MKDITIATYNIRNGADVGHDWSRLAAVIRESGADVVGLQEVDMYTARSGGADTVSGLVKTTGLPHALYVPAMDYDGGQYGILLLSRYPFAETETHHLPAEGCNEPRVFECVTVLPEDGAPLTILNTHLSCESPAHRAAQIRALADFMTVHIPAERPTVLMGDFNTEDFTAFDPLRAVGYGLVNSAEHEYKTFRPNPMAIDNILYREGYLTPTAVGMTDRDTSDHNLLWCRFTLI